jgi:2-hydroxycyclohexanecarboxyl-CoA dehydrogenase
MNQSGRTAVITGGGRGIGVGIARRLGQAGARLVLLDVDEQAVASTSRDLRAELGTQVAFAVADVADRRQLAAVLDAVGGVDVVVNNAGRWSYDAFVDSDPQAWTQDISINLLGVMNMCHILLPRMIERNYGRIVNVVSDSGRVGEPNVAPYAAAKAGVMGFARSLAKEVGRSGITVNCVSLSTTLTPGAMETFSGAQLDKMTRRYPAGRLGQPEDAAEAVAYFASPAASWVTGQTLSVNGGFAML